MAKIMWKFKTRHFTVMWLIDRDVLSTDHMDHQLAKECRDNVRSGKWKCFQSEIRVIHNATKIALGEAYLGNSIYEDPATFRDHFGIAHTNYGSYFSDMVREAIAEARKNFPAFQQKARQQLAESQRLLAVRLRSRTVVSTTTA